AIGAPVVGHAHRPPAHHTLDIHPLAVVGQLVDAGNVAVNAARQPMVHVVADAVIAPVVEGIEVILGDAFDPHSPVVGVHHQHVPRAAMAAAAAVEPPRCLAAADHYSHHVVPLQIQPRQRAGFDLDLSGGALDDHALVRLARKIDVDRAALQPQL